MKVMLVFGREKEDLRVVVKLHTQELRTRFTNLIGKAKVSEAFDIAVNEAMVHEYVPPGRETANNPRLRLYEKAP